MQFIMEVNQNTATLVELSADSDLKELIISIDVALTGENKIKYQYQFDSDVSLKLILQVLI